MAAMSIGSLATVEITTAACGLVRPREHEGPEQGGA
jgi:hypothetical protein